MLVASLVHNANACDVEAKQSKTLADDLRRERDTCWNLYTNSQKDLKQYEPSCAGRKCDELFSSETAGVISTAYVGYELKAAALEDFCRHDERVNIGANFPAARLIQFKADERTTKDGLGAQEYYLVTCSWLVASAVWCH